MRLDKGVRNMEDDVWMNEPRKLYGVYENIVDTIGWTPLVKLSNIERYFGVDDELLAKLEFFNPGGSVKDRIAVYMLDNAEKEGKIVKGGVVIEPTAGNTGIGLALVARIRGYHCVFTLPDKMSLEKELLLKSLGSLVVRTPTAVPPESPLSYYNVAEILKKMVWRFGGPITLDKLINIVGELQRMVDERDISSLSRILEMDLEESPYAYVPNQYTNMYNPLAHYETLAREIWRQTDGEIDILVAGIGTGGTITGVARFLKENRDVKVVGVDPGGSVYHHLKTGLSLDEAKEKTRPYLVEGIGEDILPETVDLDLIDEIVVVGDDKAFAMTRILSRLEAILAGGSSGAALYAAIKYLKDNGIIGKKVVIIFPDTGRNYLTKIFNDDWMMENGFNICDEKVLRELI